MTENRQIYPSAAIPHLENRPGGVPFRWLEVLVQDLKRLVPDHEQDSCMVHGVGALTATYAHTLSPLEEALARQLALEARLREISGLLPRQGDPVPPEVLARIRNLSQ